MVWSCDRLASSVEWQFPWLKFNQETALTLRPWSHQGFCPQSGTQQICGESLARQSALGVLPRGSV